MVEDTGDPRSVARGPRFDFDRDVTEQAGPPSEERCHNVAKAGVDSGGLPGTGGHDRMTGHTKLTVPPDVLHFRLAGVDQVTNGLVAPRGATEATTDAGVRWEALVSQRCPVPVPCSNVTPPCALVSRSLRHSGAFDTRGTDP